MQCWRGRVGRLKQVTSQFLSKRSYLHQMVPCIDGVCLPHEFFRIDLRMFRLHMKFWERRNLTQSAIVNGQPLLGSR